MVRILTLVTALLISTLTASSQVTFILNSIPNDTPEGSELYLAGSLNKWAPDHPDYKFTLDDLGRLSLTIKSVPDTFDYKICRGTWPSVEVDSAGKDLPTRLYVDSLGNRIKLDIEQWRDMLKPRDLVSTANSNVFFTPTSIEIPRLNRRRTVRVYFPPDYSSRQGFPVIYMLDGQNAFDASTSFSGEWNIDETLDSLHFSRGFSCIVVAVYHGEKHRLNEYTPWTNDNDEGGDGDRFARFLAKDLKSYIDDNYRTLPGKDYTMIMGSSLGGLMALYTALEYPKVFGKAAIFSPNLEWSEESFEQIEKFRKRRFQKIYISVGEKEDRKTISNVNKAKKLLKEAEFDKRELKVRIVPGGRHSEWFWGEEFPVAAKWLFGF